MIEHYLAQSYLKLNSPVVDVKLVRSYTDLINNYTHVASNRHWYYVNVNEKYINKIAISREGKIRLIQANGLMPIMHVLGTYEYKSLMELKDKHPSKYDEIITEFNNKLFSQGEYLATHPVVPVSSGMYPSVNKRSIRVQYIFIDSATEWKASNVM